MSMRVGICDYDRLYMQRLMAYVNDVSVHGESGFTFYGYTSEEQLKESALNHEVDLVLIPPGYKESFEDINLPVCFLLEEREGDGVFRYSRADRLLGGLKDRVYSERPVSVTGGTTVIGVCSPLGRSGKTRLAKGLCKCFENSLYIAFGDYQKPGQDEEMQLCDRLLFMIAARDESFYSLLDPGAREMLTGAEHMELRQLTAEDVSFMTAVIKEHAEYRYAVLDIGTGAMSDLKLLLACDLVIVTTLKDDYACERLDVFKKLISCGPLTGLGPRLRYMEVSEDDTSLMYLIRREFT